MLEYITLFTCSFLYIGIKSFQQINVVTGRYLSAFFTTQLMAIVEVCLTGFIAVASVTIASGGQGVLQILHVSTPIGLGGGLGCIVGMYLQSKRNK